MSNTMGSFSIAFTVRDTDYWPVVGDYEWLGNDSYDSVRNELQRVAYDACLKWYEDHPGVLVTEPT